MGIKQLYNDKLRKLPNTYGDVFVMWFFGRTLRLFPAWAFAGRPCDKYHKLISWLKLLEYPNNITYYDR